MLTTSTLPNVPLEYVLPVSSRQPHSITLACIVSRVIVSTVGLFQYDRPTRLAKHAANNRYQTYTVGLR